MCFYSPFAPKEAKGHDQFIPRMMCRLNFLFASLERGMISTVLGLASCYLHRTDVHTW